MAQVDKTSPQYPHDKALEIISGQSMSRNSNAMYADMPRISLLHQNPDLPQYPMLMPQLPQHQSPSPKIPVTPAPEHHHLNKLVLLRYLPADEQDQEQSLLRLNIGAIAL